MLSIMSIQTSFCLSGMRNKDRTTLVSIYVTKIKTPYVSIIYLIEKAVIIAIITSYQSHYYDCILSLIFIQNGSNDANYAYSLRDH